MKYWPLADSSPISLNRSMLGSNLPNPHPTGCFWHDYAEKWGVPDIKYCEETICHFISEPANTWSNLGFILIGLILHFWLKKQKGEKTRFLELYGLNMIFVGVTSFLYHLSNNFLTQFIDFLGMYAFFGLLLLGNLEWLGRIKKESLLPVYLVSFIPFSLLLLSFRMMGIPVQLSIALVIVFGLGTKLMILRRASFDKGVFFVTLFIFVLALSCQVMDIKRVACDPTNHVIQFHGLWHIFNAIAMLFLFIHYKRLRPRSKEF